MGAPSATRATLRTCRSGNHRAGTGREEYRVIRGPANLPSKRGASRRTLHLRRAGRSEEHTSELQSLMRISYAVFCLKKKNIQHTIYSLTLTYTSTVLSVYIKLQLYFSSPHF